MRSACRELTSLEMASALTRSVHHPFGEVQHLRTHVQPCFRRGLAVNDELHPILLQNESDHAAVLKKILGFSDSQDAAPSQCFDKVSALPLLRGVHEERMALTRLFDVFN